MKKEKQLPPFEISIPIEIGEQKNEYSIKMPNNGQLIDIQVMVYNLMQGGNLVANNTKSAYIAYLTVEMIATYTVLIPQLKKDLNVDSLLDLNPLQTKKMLSSFIQVYRPWWDKWELILNEKDEESNG